MTQAGFSFYWLMNIWATLVMSHFPDHWCCDDVIGRSNDPINHLIVSHGYLYWVCNSKPSMLGWAKWITYINPVSYIFESIMVNEFYDRQFECSQYIPSGPGYENVDSKIKCALLWGQFQENHLSTEPTT